MSKDLPKYHCNRDIKYLIIHCSASKITSNFSVAALRHLHVNINHWSDIGYHFYITKDGVIHDCRPVNITGAHCKGYNSCSIGICYEGGLDSSGKACDTRTEKQKSSLLRLLADLKQVYPSAMIVGHYELGARKACPCFCASKEYSFLNQN